MKIVTEKRDDQFVAYLAGRAEICGMGKTRREAVGHLIREHSDLFGIDFQDIPPWHVHPKHWGPYMMWPRK